MAGVKKPSHSKSGATLDSHGGRETEGFRLVNPPTAHGSTVLFPDARTFMAKSSPWFYGRTGSATHRAFEDHLCELEEAETCTLAGSGVAAVSLAILACVDAGGHVLITDNAYDPTRGMCDGLLSRMGVETTYYPPSVGSGIDAYFKDNTQLVFCESPGSLTFEVQDLPAIIDKARARNISVAVDNTWAAGVFLKPLTMGADLSIQAITKYVGGHSDLLMGAVLAADKRMAGRVARTARALGTSVSGHDVALAHRGLRTLHRRLEQHQSSALNIAHWLAEQHLVRDVLHPGLASSPDHALWKRDFTGASGLFSFVVDWTDEAKTAAFIDTLQFFGIGYSWGGFESLCIPADPRTCRSATEWTQTGQLLRLHIGLEDEDDLIGDLRRGFDAVVELED